jgi:hypothetical protein
METRQMAERVQLLVSEGMSMEKALQKVLGEKQPTTRDTRLDWIQQTENIQLLQEQAHKSHAKKSKTIHGTKDKPEVVAIYQAEIDACNARIQELKAKVSSDNPLQDLIKLGAKPSTVVQYWLKATEEKAEERYNEFKKKNKLTNKDAKQLCLKASKDLPEVFNKELASIGKDYLANVVDRLGRNDQRILALVRKWNVVS